MPQSLCVTPFIGHQAAEWDHMVEQSFQGTLLHTRRFLSYHGDRFDDQSLVITRNGQWLGLLPAARHPAEPGLVVSHPGSTYGGIVHGGDLQGHTMLAALRGIADFYRDQGFSCLSYKAVPGFYHRTPAQDDVYALFQLGAKRSRCDLSSTIDLAHRRRPSERRRRSLKKAQKAGLRLVQGASWLTPLWPVVTENLRREHGAVPVHSVEEINDLAHRFPHAIQCLCACLGDQVVAGIVLFITPTCHHAQYIASSLEGYAVQALDLVFDHAIQQAAPPVRWFDFGISTEQAGLFLNDGLYRFKSEFGGGGFVHEFYELDLLTS